MSTCQSCGVEFERSDDEVITTSRVLCPACAAERRAQLQARKAGALQQAAGPAAARAPAARMPSPQPPTSVRPEPARRGAAPSPGAQPPGAQPHHFDLKQQRIAEQKRLAKIGWMVVGGLGLLTAAVLLFVRSEQDTRREANAAHEKRLDDLRRDVLAVDLGDEAALKRMKDVIAAERKFWHGSRIEGDVTGHLVKVNSALQSIIKTRGLREALDGIEGVLAAGASGAVLAEQFATLRGGDLALQASEAGGELATRFGRVTQKVRQQYIECLRTATAAAANATTGEALAPFAALEDTLRTVLGDAIAQNDVPTQTTCAPLLKQVYAQVNGIAAKLFDDAYQERVAWVDALADAKSWTAVTSSSFEHRFGSGLTLTNAAGDGAASGGLSYTPGNRWRDYVLDVEFRLDSGTMVVYTRVGDVMDSKMVPAFTVGTKSSNVLVESGRVHAMVVRTIGNQLTVLLDGTVAHADEIGATKSRVGEPGLVAQVGTSATITRLRVRPLR